ncbi:hypothetical protein HK101_003839 [Irineochytrium annulatum]|nr:hypothetical protein HK101_003839 [Irineochytrium annulatum]
MNNGQSTTEPASTDGQTPEELTAFVETILKQLVTIYDVQQGKFEEMSSQIMGKTGAHHSSPLVNDMGNRLEDLEKSIGHLVSETETDVAAIDDGKKPSFADCPNLLVIMMMTLYATRAATQQVLRLRGYATQSVKTFANQGAIPRLPIPPLSQTVAKYLESCKPLLSKDEMARTQAAVEEFAKPGGFGEILQSRLGEVDKKAENSWLEDIWLNKAYLEWREPSLINVNYWCQFADHPNMPKDLFGSKAITPYQVERAAAFITNAINAKEMIDKIPGEKADTIHRQPSGSTHIVVFIRDQIYKVHVTRPDGGRVPVKEIERDEHSTQAYTNLMKIDPQNAKSFEAIKSALFAVCLDEFSTSSDIDLSHHQIFHNFNAHNRWFDKAIQFVISSSGRAGFNGEHTPTDAVIPGRIMEYIVSNEPAADPKEVVDDQLPAPTKLQWKINDKIKALMANAEKTAQDLIDDTESLLLQTDLYGGQFIKDTGKCSPDAYVQLALQLSWRRMHTEPTAIYESASTRLFKHGRTETGRSCTLDTWAFATGFDDPSKSSDEVKALFRKGIRSQSDYMKDATFGKGIDRHLLGLRCQIRDGETPKATLFTDPAYLKSMYFKLSTSNMSPGKYFYGGFGPVVPEGYGINYAIGKNDLKFSISAKRSCKDTDPRKFRETLLRTLEDIPKKAF